MNWSIRRWLPFGIIVVIIFVMFLFTLTTRNSIYVPDTADPVVIYKDACASCHGSMGEGTELFYPALNLEKINKSEVENIIKNGSFMMPAFTLIRTDTLQRLVNFIMEKKFIEEGKVPPKRTLFSE